MDLRDEQIQFLQMVFMECPYPDESQRAALARDLGLHHQQIRYWFMNHRAKMGLEEELDGDNYFSSSEDEDEDSKDKDNDSKDKDDDSKDKVDEKKKKDDDKIH